MRRIQSRSFGKNLIAKKKTKMECSSCALSISGALGINGTLVASSELGENHQNKKLSSQMALIYIFKVPSCVLKLNIIIFLVASSIIC